MRLFLMILALSPAMAWAQNVNQLPVDFSFAMNPGGQTNLVDGWTTRDIQSSHFTDYAQRLWNAAVAGKITLPVNAFGNTEATWYVEKSQLTRSVPCGNVTEWQPESDDTVPMGHEMSLAMFTQCPLAFADSLQGIYVEGTSAAKSDLMNSAIARSGVPGYWNTSALPIATTVFSQRFFGAGGYARWSFDRPGEALPFEIFASKLGGTLIPLDKAWGAIPRPVITAQSTETTMMPPFLQAADRVVGPIAGRLPSIWLANIPSSLVITSPERSAFGFTKAGDPTDGLHVRTQPQGIILFPNAPSGGDATVVNPSGVSFQIIQSTAGVATTTIRPLKMTIFDLNGNSLFTEQWTPIVNFGGQNMWNGSLYPEVPCGQSWCPSPLLADGAYSYALCVLDPSKSNCDITQVEHFIVDHSGWTNGNLVVMTNTDGGMNYGTLNQTQLSLAPGQGYAIAYHPGAVAISGLPDHYAEVALTDGNVTRLFPWVPEAPQNVWDWSNRDDPNVLAAVNAATFQYTGQVVAGSWSTLITVGASHDNPVRLSLGADGTFPKVAKSNYGDVQVVFSDENGHEWLAPMSYASTQQINVLVPWELPTGAKVSVQVKLNGTLSNARHLTVAPAEPSIFLINAAVGLGAVIHGKTGAPVTASDPAIPGEALSAYGTGFGAVSGELADGQPAPTRQLYRCNAPVTATVHGNAASVSFCGLAPGFAGLYQINFRVPSSGVVSPTSGLTFTIGGKSTNPVDLPIRN